MSPGSSSAISANTTGSGGGVAGLDAAAGVVGLAGGGGSRVSESVSVGLDSQPRSRPPPLTRLGLPNVGVIVK